jgi:hypothetical protein
MLSSPRLVGNILEGLAKPSMDALKRARPGRY